MCELLTWCSVVLASLTFNFPVKIIHVVRNRQQISLLVPLPGHHFKNTSFSYTYIYYCIKTHFNRLHSALKALVYSHSYEKVSNMECSLGKNFSLGFQCSVSEMEFFFSAMLDILPLFIYVFLSRAPDLLFYLHFCISDLLPLTYSQVRQVDICINNHTDEDDKRGILTHT